MPSREPAPEHANATRPQKLQQGSRERRPEHVVLPRVSTSEGRSFTPTASLCTSLLCWLAPLLGHFGLHDALASAPVARVPPHATCHTRPGLNDSFSPVAAAVWDGGVNGRILIPTRKIFNLYPGVPV